MIYRFAQLEDIPTLVALQSKFHVSTILESDKKDGFVTTLFTEEQLKDLIELENGISVACDGDTIVAYVMAASWEYWKAWPFFRNMIEDLSNNQYLNQVVDTVNSYQYGPICIDKAYRGTEVLRNIFEFSRVEMEKRFPILITFVNHINPRSYQAHVKKLGLDVVKDFEYNNNNYYLLAYDTSVKTKEV